MVNGNQSLIPNIDVYSVEIPRPNGNKNEEEEGGRIVNTNKLTRRVLFPCLRLLGGSVLGFPLFVLLLSFRRI